MHGIAGQPRTDLTTDLGGRAIAADQIIGGDQQRLAGVQILRFRCHPVIGLVETEHLARGSDSAGRGIVAAYSTSTGSRKI